jgi:hypothetical protein
MIQKREEKRESKEEQRANRLSILLFSLFPSVPGGYKNTRSPMLRPSYRQENQKTTTRSYNLMIQQRLGNEDVKMKFCRRFFNFKNLFFFCLDENKIRNKR